MIERRNRFGEFARESSNVSMTMVQVRVMRMTVHQIAVAMGVAVRFARRIVRFVTMRVVWIVRMEMLVFQALVCVTVFVTFGEMQPQPDGHEQPCQYQALRRRFAEQGDRQGSSDEGRQSEIGPGSGRAQMAQGQNEQHQADAIAQEPDKPHRKRAVQHGKLRAERQRQKEIYGSRRKPFDHGDLDRIGRR